MKCTACGCLGAYELFRGIVCWNQPCRNFSNDVIYGSEFSDDGTLVNGDPVSAVTKFLNSKGQKDNPFV